RSSAMPRASGSGPRSAKAASRALAPSRPVPASEGRPQRERPQRGSSSPGLIAELDRPLHHALDRPLDPGDRQPLEPVLGVVVGPCPELLLVAREALRPA